MLFSAPFEHANRPSPRRRSEAGEPPSLLLIGGARARSTYRAILAHDGYDILDAGEAGEGLRLASSLRPNLILLELAMPGRDGWETMRLLKADVATYLIPVVASSLTMLPQGIYQRARSAGFVDYITRPVERRHVREVVATWTRPPEKAIF